jgi:hypothetical protein
MTSLDSAIKKLRRLAAKDAVEVEHLSALAMIGNVKTVPVIRELQEHHSWPHGNRQGDKHVVPLGRWADVVCVYLEGGTDALVTYARRKEAESFYFAVSILGDLKSSASVLALAELATGVESHLQTGIEDAIKLAEAINVILSFKGSPVMYEQTAAELRRFLHALLQRELSESQRATAVCALRGVGDESSIELIRAMPIFAAPWSGLESTAIKAIGKRLRRQRGSS